MAQSSVKMLEYSRCQLGKKCVVQTDDNYVFRKFTLLVAINNSGCVGSKLYPSQDGRANRDSLYNSKNQILNNLIRFVIKNINLDKHEAVTYYSRVWYIRQLLSKYDLLLQFGVDLKKYHIDKKILNSPPSIKSQRSVYKESRGQNGLNRTNDQQESTFLKTISNTKLLKILNKLYIRSVQSTKYAENDFDRIMKIRHYFIKKYKPIYNYEKDENVDFFHITAVERDKELQAFFEQTRELKDLNVKYKIKYSNAIDGIAIDYGGVLKQFFTNISKQVKDTYFERVANDNGYISDRYILKASLSAEQAKFVGELLTLFVIYNIHIPFTLSNIYLGYMMFEYDKISDEELLLYYLLDLDTTERQYLVNACSVEDQDILDEYCNPELLKETFIKQVYRFDHKVFKAFISGFSIEKNHFHYVHRVINDKIRLYDMDKLLSCREETTSAAYNKYIFRELSLYTRDADGESELLDKTQQDSILLFTYLKEMFTTDTNTTFEDMYKLHKTDSVDMQKTKSQYKTKQAFCSALLLFWTALERIDMNKEPYVVTYVPHGEQILSHTCSKELELPGSANINTKQDLYNTFMNIFIFNMQNEFGMM
jgi:hypothetical protein